MPTFITEYGILSPDFVGMTNGTTPVGGRLSEALTTRVDRYGQPKATLGQAIAGMVGLYATDPTTTRAINLKRMQTDLQQTKARMTYLIRDPNLNSQERQNIIAVYREEIAQRAQEIADYTKESAVPQKLLANQ